MFEILRNHINKIVPLTDLEFEFIASLFTAKSYKKGQFLFQEGENVSKHYFICKGLLKLVYNDSDAREHIVGFAMEDWWESDFESFYTQKKTSMSLICLENTDVLFIGFENYINLVRTLPKIEHFFLEKAYFGFIAAQKRIISSLTSDTKERYHQLIERHPTLVQRVPKSQLAAYLGVSRETLSRITI
ncbi:Crp/Fnr family transcriptional regulator [Sphingobacterium faecium]|uniref:Crp/Fnr family transcriptional regulator n=1 Tax=Sphingobacterium faecium TaxID=34087 RepID=UPI0024685549|nr:Crp/Fnr family transcriptional regulator [Sphingobacterium faecium]MDH5826687.1 Crp/Fnr family transcriptional regulator [Sphingobacterium faecium]